MKLILRSFVVPLLAAAFFSNASLSQADEVDLCDLQVEMVGLESNRGEMILALFAKADAFDRDQPPLRAVHSPIAKEKSRAEFIALPCGQYALKVFHDENANGKLDTNFVGFPTEAFGFSNDVMGSFGPPSFEAARFKISAPRHQLTIQMK